MSKMNYELYIDESGDFSSDDLNRNRIASFVGGVLCPSKAVSGQTIDRMIDGPIHAMESYDKEWFFSIIESLLQKGCRIVLFENNDRIRVQDGDTTYLNIITEGLTKLLRDLHNEDPEALIDISILIATRQNSEEREKGNTIRIAESEYLRRFEEKMLVSLGRNKIDHVTFTISFAMRKRTKGSCWLISSAIHGLAAKPKSSSQWKIARRSQTYTKTASVTKCMKILMPGTCAG